MTVADFLIFFMERNGVALIVATPAIAFVFFHPPSKWRQ